MDDKFRVNQLKVENFEAAASNKEGVSLQLRLHDGYDHSYYFVSTFIPDHFEHHAKFLLA